MDSLQLLTLNLTLTAIFSGRKAKIYLHTTPKLTTVVMPISCLLPCEDPGICVGGRGGGGSPRQSDKKALTTLLVCFFAFYLVLSLFYRSQMVNLKEKYHFSMFRRGSKFVRGGVQLFPAGGGGGRIAYSL